MRVVDGDLCTERTFEQDTRSAEREDEPSSSAAGHLVAIHPMAVPPSHYQLLRASARSIFTNSLQVTRKHSPPFMASSPAKYCAAGQRYRACRGGGLSLFYIPNHLPAFQS